MRILILGAGVVGVSSAWHLLKDGHDVTVIDRALPAQGGASFGNAGLIAPGHSFAWASPKALKVLLKSFYRQDQAFRMRFPPDLQLLDWGLRFLSQCNNTAARTNTLAKHRLCLYSQKILQQMVEETGIGYEQRSGGLLYLHRNKDSLEAGSANMKILEEDGLPLEIVDPDRAAEIDPCLKKVRHRIAGGIFIPGDESGDSRMFTEGLTRACEKMGGKFIFGPVIRSIEADQNQVERVVTHQGDFEADLYLLCLGCWSPQLTKPIGVNLPVYPVKGYSISFPIQNEEEAPRLGGVDEDHLLAYAPMGKRLRLTSYAEFAGYDTRHQPQDFTLMTQHAKSLFPEACDYTQPSYWAGLRPMTPEGFPIFGTGKHHNLYYNTGHGHMGWTMSCGSAKIIADLVASRKPEFDISAMGVR